MTRIDSLCKVVAFENDPEYRQSRRAFMATGSTLALGLISSGLATAEDERPVKGGFVPPNAEKRRKAIGSLNGLSAELKRAFDPGDDFEPMPAPKAGEWLAEHQEKGQAFDQFVASRPNRPDARRSTIYLVPFGDFDAEWSPKLADLEVCASAFFQVTVKSLPPRPLDEKQITSREKSGKRQYLSPDFLQFLSTILPTDGFAILGITMQDLYPDPAWNYVFGQASPRDRVGIYSFARYDPLFWGEKRTPGARESLLERSLGVLLHETGHMFGMAHCIFYRCLMNGANNLEESDHQPLHLCPVCLRKLHSSVGFTVIKRYEALLKEYVRLGINEESEWLEARLTFLRKE